MIRAARLFVFAATAAFAVYLGLNFSDKVVRTPQPETLTCARVKEVTPAGTINYLCEVRK